MKNLFQKLAGTNTMTLLKLLTVLLCLLSPIIIGCGGGGDGGSTQPMAIQLGDWDGTDISFTVREGSYYVDNLSITYRGHAAGTICSYDYETTQSIGVSLLVDDDGFFSHDSGGLSIDGTFNSETSATVSIDWSMYNAQCDATESGSQSYSVLPIGQPAGASTRFYNNLTCSDVPFTATLDMCGTTLVSNSGVWSNCEALATGTCAFTLTTQNTNCGTITTSGTFNAEEGQIYEAWLALENGNPALSIGYRSGDCSTPVPFFAPQQDPGFSDDSDYDGIIRFELEDFDQSFGSIN